MQGINIQQIDNGYLVAYPDGEPSIIQTPQGPQQQARMKVHYCATMQEVADYLLEINK